MADFGDIGRGVGQVAGGVGQVGLGLLRSSGNIIPAVRQARQFTAQQQQKQEALKQKQQDEADKQRATDLKDIWKGLGDDDPRKDVALKAFTEAAGIEEIIDTDNMSAPEKKSFMGFMGPTLDAFNAGKLGKSDVMRKLTTFLALNPQKGTQVKAFREEFTTAAAERDIDVAGRLGRLPEDISAQIGAPGIAQQLLAGTEEGRKVLAAAEPGERKIISGVTLGEETGTLQETEPGSGVFRVLEVAGVPAKGKKRAGVEITLGKPASASERTALAETLASIDSLNNLKVLFDESFVGPAAGRGGTIKNIFGLNPDKQAAFIAATAAVRNQVIKDITGAQMSEPEAKRIMQQIPQENDAPNVWQAKWEQSLRNLERLNKRRKEVLKQSGLRVPEGDAEEDLSNLSDDELLKRLQ